MNICGIITEYNPMHLGHDYQFKAAKDLTGAQGTILVMSGNFVQRGEPAIIDKYARARAAVANGIDLVLELPVHFATASAEFFSNSSVRILDATNVVSHLNFGSESGDITAIRSLADLLTEEPLGYKVLLNDLLKEGQSFPAAREKALVAYNVIHKVLDPVSLELIRTPNNILGIEYIKSLNRLNSTIKPTTVKRIGATYHDEDSHVPVPSATSIRKHLHTGEPLKDLAKKMPSPSYEALAEAIGSGTAPIFPEDTFPFIKHKLLTTSPDELAGFTDVSEGLENRFIKAAVTSDSYEAFIHEVMTKRYTRTRIARAMLHIFLGHKKENFTRYYHDMNPYLKVLALNQQGQTILKMIKEANEDLPIIVNNRQGYKKLDDLQKKCYLEDLNSTLLYNHLINTKFGTTTKNEYQMKIIPT